MNACERRRGPCPPKGARASSTPTPPPMRGGAISPRVSGRRCPTLPPSLPSSTIGAGGLSFRVRNVTGRFPTAMTTGPRGPGSTTHRLQPENRTADAHTHRQQQPLRPVPGRDHFATKTIPCVFDPSNVPHSSPPQPTTTPYRDGKWCALVTSDRLISTGQLHNSLVVASTPGLSTL